MTTDREANIFYNKIKHVNDFLYRQDNFKTPDHTVSIDNSVKQMSDNESEVSMDSFQHTSDFFKKAKATLRQKGQI